MADIKTTPFFLDDDALMGRSAFRGISLVDAFGGR